MKRLLSTYIEKARLLTLSSAAMLKPLPLLVAQITDMHLFAAIDRQLLDLPTNDSLQAVLERLAKLQPKPDILLLTGDLSQDGSHKSYQRLQNLLVPFEIPTYWLAGNHDNLPVMQQVLSHPPISIAILNELWKR